MQWQCYSSISHCKQKYLQTCSLLHFVCTVSGAKMFNKNKQVKSKASETCLPPLVSAKIRDRLSCQSNIYFCQRNQ